MQTRLLNEAEPATPSHLKVGDAVRIMRLFGNDVAGDVTAVRDREVVVLAAGPSCATHGKS